MTEGAKTPELLDVFDNEWNFLFGIAGIREKLDQNKKSYEFLLLHSLQKIKKKIDCLKDE
jgi:hypothetical protein